MMGNKDKDEDKNDYIFSKELRESLAPFGKMDVRDCLKSKDFLKALSNYAGMSDEKFEEIFKDK